MILYYAMGGGLGHLTRSLAILKNAPELCGAVRLMTASRLTSLVRPLIPCPVDIVDDVILSSKKRYYNFLNTYLATYRINAIILDTFPSGIAGEWEHVAPKIPRILIARYLNPDIYFKKIRSRAFLAPAHALSIEPLETAYINLLRRNSILNALDAPITLSSHAVPEKNHPRKDKWLIVHSGSDTETRTLIRLAGEKIRGSGDSEIKVDTCFQRDNIYPAEQIMPQYSVIISGAGYNMVSIASTGCQTQTYILHPFKRKFDNQFKRLDNFKKGRWLKAETNGAKEAAMYLCNAVKSLI